MSTIVKLGRSLCSFYILKYFVITTFFVWQTIPSLIGLGLYFSGRRYITKRYKQFFIFGLVLAILGMLFQLHLMNWPPVTGYFEHGWVINKVVLESLLTGYFQTATFIALAMGCYYTLALPILIAALFASLKAE